jgi:tetratricopeptide (TPR) repeat protein
MMTKSGASNRSTRTNAKPPPQPVATRQISFPLIFILIVTVTVFFRAFTSEYVEWDDNIFIARNIQLTFDFIPAVGAAFSGFFYGDYLPLTLMSYWFEVQIFGQDPAAQHVTNLVLHLLNVALLYFWLSKFMSDRGLALFVTAAFAIHPMQAEVVMWISDRKSLLCIFFTLLAMLTAERSWKEDRLKWRILYPVLFLCALLSKATTLFLPVLLVLSDLLIHKRPWKASAIRHAPVFLVSFVMGLTRLAAYRSLAGEFQNQAIQSGALTEMPLRILDTLGFYVRKFFWPAPQSIIYPDFSISAIDYMNYAAIALAIAFVGYYGWHRRDRRVLFLALMYFLFLLPVLQIVPRINYVNDRMSYLPLVAIAGLAFIFVGKFAKEAVLRHLWIGALALLAFPTLSRTAVWETNLALWEDAVQKAPWNALAHNNYGLALSAQQRFDEAIKQYELAVHDNGRGASDVTALAYNNMAGLRLRPDLPGLYDMKAAENDLRQALKFNRSPLDQLTIKYNLAGLLASQGRDPEALQILTGLRADLNATPDLSSRQLIQLVEKAINGINAKQR